MSTDRHRKDQEIRDLPLKAIETDYPEHEKNPGPSEEAVVEKDEDGAGKVLRWIIPLLVIVLVVFWLIMR
jgi:hypothetical protein